MSKHLSQDTWIYLINLFESKSDKFIEEFKSLTHRNWDSRHVRCAFKRMVKRYNQSNNDPNVFVSQTGKAPKKGKGSGRPRKEESLDRLTEIFINEFPKEELHKIIKEYIKKNKNKDNGELIKKIIQNSSLSLTELSLVLETSELALNKLLNITNVLN